MPDWLGNRSLKFLGGGVQGDAETGGMDRLRFLSLVAGMDMDLEAAARSVSQQYEFVPWFEEQFAPDQLFFRLLPAEMLDVLHTSVDYVPLKVGVPVLLKLSSGERQAGLMVFKHPKSGLLYVMAPSDPERRVT
jgi:hypothetical protein